MNLVLLEDAELLDSGQAVVRGVRARHIHDVHHAAVGDTLSVGLVGGLMGEGVVTALTRDEVTLAVQLSERPPTPLGLDLLLAMPRPKMLRRLLAGVASMGVKRLVLLNSARVEKSYFDSPYLSPAAIGEALRLGLSQARDTILPQVSIHRRFRPFVEDQVDVCWPAPARRLLAHPEAPHDLFGAWSADPSHPAEVPPHGCRVGDPAEAPQHGSHVGDPAETATVLAIGPEGGWVPFELELLEARGFQRFTAGPRVMRVDTAVPFLIGQFALHARRIRGD